MKVAAVFSDNCVLQREKNIDIFGTGEDGKTVRASLLDGKGGTLAENRAQVCGGKWKVVLPPQKAQNGCTLVVQCEGIVKKFANVAVGEVWLCGGQSNMEFELQNCAEGAGELQSAQDPNVRFYYTNKIAWIDGDFYKAEERTRWQTWDSEWKKAWSAVGYFFAKKLAADLGVTIGLVGCNWGGTSASAWMRREFLEKDADLNTYLVEQEEATRGKSVEEQCREYDEYAARDAEWNRRAQEVYKISPDIEWEELQKLVGKNEWPGPKSCKNPFRPCGLYECMVRRVLPYTLRGVLWYQGESDDHKPQSYAKLFTAMIDNWRTDWNDDTLPFVFVQLPVHRYRLDRDFKHWCLVREAQEKVAKTVANTHMAVALDLGQYNDIHPKAKKALGERLERLALREIYGGSLGAEEARSPVLKAALPTGGEMLLTFDNAESGFVVKADSARLAELKEMEAQHGNAVGDGWTGFELAGSDGKFFPAQPRFGKGEIALSSPDVPAPVAARYAWYNYCPVTVYNRAGLPLAPFRTAKDGQLAAGHAAVQQTMTVGTGGN